MNYSKSVPETEENGSAPVWFHCNICSIQPTKNHHQTLTFFVTSCQHIFCYECLRNFASQSPDVCPLCKTTTRVIEFRKIGPDIAAMFESILPEVMMTMKSTQFHFRQAEHFVQVLNKKRATLQARHRQKQGENGDDQGRSWFNSVTTRTPQGRIFQPETTWTGWAKATLGNESFWRYRKCSFRFSAQHNGVGTLVFRLGVKTSLDGLSRIKAEDLNSLTNVPVEFVMAWHYFRAVMTSKKEPLINSVRHSIRIFKGFLRR